MGHATSHHALDRVLAYHHHGVCDKLVSELGYAPEAAERLFTDTLRFLALAGIPDIRATTMALAADMGYTVNTVHVCIAPTRAIDEAWHRFVLFTHDYARFCAQHFGKFLHHQPVASPAQLEEVVRGDDLIRLARTVYGDDLDLTNWQGDSTNSGTCCAGGDEPSCDVCNDDRTHCYACCKDRACRVCPAFRKRLTAAYRQWRASESQHWSAKWRISHPIEELERRIDGNKSTRKAGHTRVQEFRHEARALEQQHRKLEQQIEKWGYDLATIERELPPLEAQLADARERMRRERDTTLPPLEAALRRLKARYDRLLTAHREALRRQTERS